MNALESEVAELERERAVESAEVIARRALDRASTRPFPELNQHADAVFPSLTCELCGVPPFTGANEPSALLLLAGHYVHAHREKLVKWDGSVPADRL